MTAPFASWLSAPRPLLAGRSVLRGSSMAKLPSVDFDHRRFVTLVMALLWRANSVGSDW